MSHDELFEKYFREELTVGELDELKRLLRDSDEARGEFARFTGERSILVRLTGRLAGQESRELPDLPAPAFRALPPRPAAPRPAQKRTNPYWIVAAASAAAVLLLTMALLLVPTRKTPREEITRREPVKVTPAPAPIPGPLPAPETPAPKVEVPAPTPEAPAPKPEEPKKPEAAVPAPKPETPAPKPEEPKKPEPPRRETDRKSVV